MQGGAELQRQLRRAKYVVFDFDETMFLTLRHWHTINREALREFGIDADVEEFQARICGKCI